MQLNVDSVAWLEGSYVSPQHFQQQERFFTNYISRFFNLQHPGEFGFARMVLVPELLQVGKIAIREAYGVFPDMTPFVVDKQLVIDIPEDYRNQMVHLVMPLSRHGDREVGPEDSETGRYRYTLNSEELMDNTNPDNPSVKVSLARLQTGLVLGGRDLSHYSYLPVAKIQMIDATGGVQLDRRFIPPLLNIHVSNRLSLWLQDYHTRISQRVTMMTKRLHSGRGYKSPQALYRDQLWLMVLSEWHARIGCYKNTRHIPPKELYMSLQAMAGAISGLLLTPSPKTDDLNPYKLHEAFGPLLDYLSDAIHDSGYEWVSELTADDSDFNSTGLLTYDLPENLSDCRLIIAIPETLALRLGKDTSSYLTLAPNVCITELVHDAMPGIPIKELPLPPSEINLTDHIYLEPDYSTPLFQQLRQDDVQLAMHLDHQVNSTQIRIFLIRQ